MVRFGEKEIAKEKFFLRSFNVDNIVTSKLKILKKIKCCTSL